MSTYLDDHSSFLGEWFTQFTGAYTGSTPTLPVRVWLSSPATILLHSLVESVPHDLLLLLIAVGILTVTGTILH